MYAMTQLTKGVRKSRSCDDSALVDVHFGDLRHERNSCSDDSGCRVAKFDPRANRVPPFRSVQPNLEYQLTHVPLHVPDHRRRRIDI